MLRNSDTSTIFGLNIVVLVLAILELLGCLLIVAFLSWFGIAGSESMLELLNDVSIEATEELNSSTISYDSDVATIVPVDLGWSPSEMTNSIGSGTDLNTNDITGSETLAEAAGATTTFLFLSGAVFGMIFVVFYPITCIVSMIGGILGVRNARNPLKAKGIFGWSIAGAALALITARWVTMVLQIISAVFAHRIYTKYFPIGQQQTVGQPVPIDYVSQQGTPVILQQPMQNAAPQPVQQQHPQQTSPTPTQG